MADKSFTIFMLLKPLGAAAFLGAVYGFMWLLWKYLPDGWVKRLLFFHFWGKAEDPGPWAREMPKDVHLGRIDPQGPASLPQYRSPEADPPPSSRPPHAP